MFLSDRFVTLQIGIPPEASVFQLHNTWVVATCSLLLIAWWYVFIVICKIWKGCHYFFSMFIQNWMVVSNIFQFSSLVGEDSYFDQYFSDGLKPPTRKLEFFKKMCFIVQSLGVSDRSSGQRRPAEGSTSKKSIFWLPHKDTRIQHTNENVPFQLVRVYFFSILHGCFFN